MAPRPDDLSRLLLLTEQARRVWIGRRLQVHGLNLAQWVVLEVLRREGLSTMSRLADTAGMDRTSVTRTVDGLQTLALVSRAAAREDRRLVLVDLLPAGSVLIARVEAEIADDQAALFDGLDDVDRDRLLAMLTRVHATLKGRLAEAPSPPLRVTGLRPSNRSLRQDGFSP